LKANDGHVRAGWKGKRRGTFCKEGRQTRTSMLLARRAGQFVLRTFFGTRGKNRLPAIASDNATSTAASSGDEADDAETIVEGVHLEDGPGHVVDCRAGVGGGRDPFAAGSRR